MLSEKALERQRLIAITLHIPNWESDPLLREEVKMLRKKLYNAGRKGGENLGKLDPATFTAEDYKRLIRQRHSKTDIRLALGWTRSKIDHWTSEQELFKHAILREAGMIVDE